MQKKKKQAAVAKLEELDSELSNVMLCGFKGAGCVILAPRAFKQNEEQCGRGGIGRWNNWSVQVTERV